MEELMNKLNAIPDSYSAFVLGIVSYVKQKPSRLKSVLQYIDEPNNHTTSDVVEFVMSQSDFHEYGLGLRENAG